MIRVDKEALRPYLILVVVAAILYVFFVYVSPLLLPFLLALALAVLIDRPVRWLEERRVPRPVAVGTMLVIALLLLTFLLVFGMAALTVEVSQLSSALPALTLQILQLVEQLENLLERYFEEVPPYLADFLRQQGEVVRQWLSLLTRQLFELVGQWTFQGIPNLTFVMLVTGVATYMMSRDREKILAFLPYLIPGPWRAKTVEVVAGFTRSVIGFFNALVVLVSITAAVTVVVLTMLGSSYALLIGVLTGLLDVLPVVGPGLVFLPWALYHFVMGDPMFGVWLAATYGGLVVGRTILEPRIIGDRIGIHPLATLISLYVGLKLFGVSGFIIGPISAIILVSLARAGIVGLDNGDVAASGRDAAADTPADASQGAAAAPAVTEAAPETPAADGAGRAAAEDPAFNAASGAPAAPDGTAAAPAEAVPPKKPPDPRP